MTSGHTHLFLLNNEGDLEDEETDEGELSLLRYFKKDKVSRDLRAEVLMALDTL